MFLVLVSKWWKAGLGIIVGLTIGYGVHKVTMIFVDAAHKQELETQRTALIEQCEKDKEITNEVSTTYQGKIAALNAQLRNLKRLRERTVCIPVANSSGGRDAATSDTKHVGENGITTDALYDYAAECEEYSLRLDSCQAFINKTWSSR